MTKQNAILHASLATFALTVSACSSPTAKSDPNWIDDVRTVVQGNCLRCHSSPASSGAPTDFRLDVYEDTVKLDGRVIRGAATMAPFVAARAGIQGTMPPDFERTPAERDTFINWYEASKQSGIPRVGQRAQNAPPTARLRSDLPTGDKETILLDYEIVDNDGDLASGVLLIDGNVIADDLQSGRGTISISPASLANGSYDLIARISDDFETVNRNLGTLIVSHADGNAAPALSLQTTVRDGLFADENSPVLLQVVATDVDGDNTLVDVIAFRGEEEVIVADDIPTDAQGLAEISWDTTVIPEGPGWRLRISSNDGGGATSQLETGRFVISHSTTNLTFSDVQPLFIASCQSCHPRFGIRNMPHNFAEHGNTGPALGVNDLRGLIYRRVVQERNMPPQSAETLVEEWRPLTDDEIQTISEYLLGGSPL